MQTPKDSRATMCIHDDDSYLPPLCKYIYFTVKKTSRQQPVHVHHVYRYLQVGARVTFVYGAHGGLGKKKGSDTESQSAIDLNTLEDASVHRYSRGGLIVGFDMI